jgi:hypothetical protein
MQNSWAIFCEDVLAIHSNTLNPSSTKRNLIQAMHTLQGCGSYEPPLSMQLQCAQNRYQASKSLTSQTHLELKHLHPKAFIFVSDPYSMKYFVSPSTF